MIKVQYSQLLVGGGRIIQFGWILLLLFMFSCASERNENGLEINLMTLNLWHGGDAGKQPLSQTVKVVIESGADIVGFQETHGLDNPSTDRSKVIASMLGWYHFDQKSKYGKTAIISRFPIVESTPEKLGVLIELPNHQYVYVFNTHLRCCPYQPYQLLKIPYANSPFLETEIEAIATAENLRGRGQPVGGLKLLLPELEYAIDTGLPVFLTGDFNEPSHLDWTVEAKNAGIAPLKVQWPTSDAIMKLGMKDAYRFVYPNEVTHPGWTWTPVRREDDKKERHDRIDIIYLKGAKIIECKIIGEREERADIVVLPYPSDHRGVVVKAKIYE